MLNKLAGISLTATVLILVVILNLLWTLPNFQDKAGCDILCLPCDSYPADLSALCCECQTERLESYMQKAVREKNKSIKDQEEKESRENYKEPSIQMKEFLRQTRWTIKPAARMTGTPQPKPRIYDEGMIPIRAWREGQRAFKRYGIRYRNGRLVVPIPGTYNIYSYLDLYESCLTESFVNCNKSDVIVHDMVRFNILKGEDEVLMSNAHTHEVPQNGHFNIYDSYLTGVVTLEAGDEVFVRVSNLSYINSPSSNYFGVHMI